MWQFHDDTLRDVASVGSRAYYQCVVESSRGFPFDVAVACDCGHFGGYGTHNVSSHPARSGTLQLDSLLDGVRVGLCPAGFGCESRQVVGVTQEQLPVGAIVAKDCYDGAAAHWQQIGLEVGVAAVAHYDGVAVAIDHCAVGAVVGIRECGESIGFFKMHVA